MAQHGQDQGHEQGQGHDRSRRVLRWLFAIQLVSMGAMEMSAPFLPLHLRALGGLSGDALAWASALAFAGPMAMAMLLTPMWGRLGDRKGHKPMLLRALMALALAQLAIAYAPDVTSVLAIRFVQGALAGFIAAAQAYGGALVARERRGRLMAKLQVATALGSIAGPLAGGLLYDSAGFRMLNLGAAMLCACCAIVAGVMLPALAPRALRSAATSAPVSNPASVTYAAIAGLLAAIVLVQAGKMMPQVFLALFTEQVLRAPSWLTGLCYGAAAVGLCIAAPLWGKRFDSLPRQRVMLEVEAVSWVCAGMVALQACSTGPALFIGARVGWGVCLAALLPVFYSLLSRESGSADQGRVLAAGNSAAKAGALLGFGAGAAAMALLPVAWLFWPVAATYVVAAIGLRVIRHRPARAQAGSTPFNVS